MLTSMLLSALGFATGDRPKDASIAAAAGNGLHERSRIAAVKRRTCGGTPAPVRVRRGSWMMSPMQWRRCDPGTNQITAFGVMKKGARRTAIRPNASGITRWHCYPRHLMPQPAVFFGAEHRKTQP